MGQGARTNEDTLYRKLELRLNELMKDSGWRIRVINLEQISLGSNREDSQRFVKERVCRH